jgi:hypothetical protein
VSKASSGGYFEQLLISDESFEKRDQLQVSSVLNEIGLLNFI